MINQLHFEMIKLYSGDMKRIQHFCKVHSYARLIAEMENIDADTLFILEAAALTHDIGRSAERCFIWIESNLSQAYIIGLLDPNGSGKTTTIIRILSMLKRTDGEVKTHTGKRVESLLVKENNMTVKIMLPVQEEETVDVGIHIFEKQRAKKIICPTAFFPFCCWADIVFLNFMSMSGFILLHFQLWF